MGAFVISMKSFAQLGQTTSESPHCKSKILSGVSILVDHCLPFTVLRTIVSIVIHALKCVSGRASTHISQKRLKRSPLRANLNSSSSIVMECMILGVPAPSNHGGPDRVFSGIASVASLTMFQEPDSTHKSSETAARCARASLQASEKNGLNCPTLAATENHSSVSRRRNSGRQFLNNFQLSKNESDGRYSSRHNVGRFNVVFSGGRPATTGAHCDTVNIFTKGVN